MPMFSRGIVKERKCFLLWWQHFFFVFYQILPCGLVLSYSNTNTSSSSSVAFVTTLLGFNCLTVDVYFTIFTVVILYTFWQQVMLLIGDKKLNEDTATHLFICWQGLIMDTSKVKSENERISCCSTKTIRTITIIGLKHIKTINRLF